MVVKLKDIMLNDTPKCRSAVSKMAHRLHETHKTHRPHYENALCSTTLQSIGVGGAKLKEVLFKMSPKSPECWTPLEDFVLKLCLKCPKCGRPGLFRRRLAIP
ncbi:MAG: hypothetical protein WC721_19235 [Victivallaceae bacterium]|jgi:hypothetical protein